MTNVVGIRVGGNVAVVDLIADILPGDAFIHWWHNDLRLKKHDEGVDLRNYNIVGKAVRKVSAVNGADGGSEDVTC